MRLRYSDAGGRAETAGAGQVIGEGAESGQQQTGRLFVGIMRVSDVTERKKVYLLGGKPKKEAAEPCRNSDYLTLIMRN